MQSKAKNEQKEKFEKQIRDVEVDLKLKMAQVKLEELEKSTLNQKLQSDTAEVSK